MKRLLAGIASVVLAAGCGSSVSSSHGSVPTSAASAINTFSPAPLATPAPAASPAPAATGTARVQPAAPAPGMTGLLADPATISQRFPMAAPAECVTAGDNPYPLGTRFAWRVGATLACTDVNATSWQGRPVGFNIYFGAPVSQEAALAVTKQLLPPDATNAVFVEGTNNPETTSHPNGTCEVANYDSPAARMAELALDPSWKSDGKVNVVLYTGQQLDDGSSSAYEASTVRFASVGIQADLDTGGCVPC
jgi:hypothetical protein